MSSDEINSTHIQPRNATTDIINGSIAGALGKIIEYPFDTVKVRLQTQDAKLFPNAWSCIKYTLQNEGVKKGFFQGIGSPIAGAAMENSVLFVAYNQCSQFIEQYKPFYNISPLQQIIIAGAFAGSCASFVLTPVELIKCKLQVSNIKNIHNVSKNLSTKIFPTILTVLKEKGVLGLWQGQSSTFIRESFGGVAWFATYELMKVSLLHRRLQNDCNGTKLENKTWELLVSGGSAGLAFNASIFPADTIKSVMQTEHLSFFKSIEKITTSYGLRGFYRGLGITLVRAAPANATVFYTFETLSKMDLW